MKNKLIESYIKNITLNDINKFASSNNISLSNENSNKIYKYIKNDWKTIIFGNPCNILNDLKHSFNNSDYIKIEKLYYAYKNKYKDLLK